MGPYYGKYDKQLQHNMLFAVLIQKVNECRKLHSYSFRGVKQSQLACVSPLLYSLMLFTLPLQISYCTKREKEIPALTLTPSSLHSLTHALPIRNLAAGNEV